MAAHRLLRTACFRVSMVLYTSRSAWGPSCWLSCQAAPPRQWTAMRPTGRGGRRSMLTRSPDPGLLPAAPAAAWLLAAGGGARPGTCSAACGLREGMPAWPVEQELILGRAAGTANNSPEHTHRAAGLSRILPAAVMPRPLFSCEGGCLQRSLMPPKYDGQHMCTQADAFCSGALRQLPATHKPTPLCSPEGACQ